MLDINYHPCQGRVAYEDAYMEFFPSSPLNRWIQSFWQLNVPVGKFSYRSMPDNSVDWIINLNSHDDNFIVTPFLSSVVFELTGPVSYFGVRFRLLGHKGLISTPLGEWGVVDNVVKAGDVLPRYLLHAACEDLSKNRSFYERCNSLSVLMLSMVKQPGVDPRLVNYMRYCHKYTASNLCLSDKQCSQFGVSARQLRRLTQLHLGLLPRDFARVLRFQYTLKAINSGSYRTAWTDHYYDQPHYIREFKRLSGLTPTEFRNMSVLYNDGSSG